MKIIEFDEEGGAEGRSVEARPSAPKLGERPIKIMEFDDGEPAASAPVPPRVGSIKIIEFDEEPGREGPSDARREPPNPRPKPLKIVDFDAQASGNPGRAARRDGIKIIEFD